MISEIASAVTGGVRINVRTHYMATESYPKCNYYVFAYQVEIINETSYIFQLTEREWHIQNLMGIKRVVCREGVLGKKPIIHPNETYSYVSGAHFNTALGKMHGFYRIIRLIDKKELQVKIPSFSLVVPFLQN